MTENEIKFYKNTCLICSNAFSRLVDHVSRKHDTSMDVYCVKFPIYATALSEANALRRKRIGEKSKGRVFSEVARKLISEKGKARHERERADNPEAYLAEQHRRAAVARSAKGDDYTHSAETIEKMRGPRPSAQGVPKSDATKMKLSEAAKRRAPTVRSDATKEKMRKAWVARKEKPEYGEYIEQISRRAKAESHVKFLRDSNSNRLQKTKGTSIELALHSFLESKGIEYQTQYALEYNGAWTYDAFVPSMNLLIEMDGEYWHSKSKAQINKDILKEKIARSNGHQIVRISDSDMNFDYLFLGEAEMMKHNRSIIEKRMAKYYVLVDVHPRTQ